MKSILSNILNKLRVILKCGNNNSILNEHRSFKINNESNSSIFPKNQIKSHKYTIWNFLPKNLFEQFRRIANLYFLISAIISMLIESPVSPLTTFLPLIFVILVTTGKQGYEDFLRYKTDQRVNCSPVNIIRNKSIQAVKCKEVIVGDLIQVLRDEDVPCDIILLHSSEKNGLCYVTTSNLDGETNLKTLQIPKITMDKSIEEIMSIDAIITCQHPQPNLYEFNGKIMMKRNNETISGSIGIENILLRGSRVKDTDYIIGTAVYTGVDTKLSLNSKIISNKFSTVEKSINKYLIFFIIILVIEIIYSIVIKESLEINYQMWFYYLGDNNNNSSRISKIINDFFSFTILYNYIIPISLYVTIEMQKFLGSFFFRWDIDMYDKHAEQPALANTSDLNEDLGQIEYLFTDKTGTLTENLMVFRRCSIDAKMYIERDCDGKLYLLTSNGNANDALKIGNWPAEIWHFMIAISLCHSVHVASPLIMEEIVAKRTAFRESFRKKTITRVNSSLLMDPNLPEYQAASADEKALVEASARCGVILLKNVKTEMEIKIGDKMLFFTKLETLEFTPERKKMSVIVEDSAGDLWLYCKGADSEMFPLMVNGKVEETQKHVTDFSQRGLRTLVMGYKKLSREEYNDFIIAVENTKLIIGSERSKKLQSVYQEMENGINLLGATGIEDRLQEGVEETLEALRVAGIKVWILTGDKVETAENIAFSCGYFKSGTKILKFMNQTTIQHSFSTLTSFERRIKLEPFQQYGLLMDGLSMAITYKYCPELLRIVSMSCDAVVCCRMSPLQKSKIVQLIKTCNKRPLTAAIGDGGNDVSMIQEAHVGIGIIGKEGRQATMSADFAFTKFMYLKKALLIHGHWYYIRISILVQYFFYKNIVFITPQFYFAFHSGFSSQNLYDSLFLMGFNVIFTSLPIFAFGLLAQDYSTKQLLFFPQYYSLNKHNRLLSIPQMLLWTFIALWQSFVIYFSTYIFWLINPVILKDNTSADLSCFSTVIYHLVILVTNTELLFRNSYWSYYFLLSILLSELAFIGVMLIYSAINIDYSGQMYWVVYELISSPTFWLLTIVIVPVCLLPDCLVAVYNAYSPSKLNFIQQREDNLHDTYSEWSSSSFEGKKFNLTPWRGYFSFIKS